jgi:hypothetical protein
MNPFFSIFCICLMNLSVTQDYVYITSVHQITEHEEHVAVVGCKLLTQPLPGETLRNNETTSVIMVGHASNQQPPRQESESSLHQPNLLSYEPSAPRHTD